MSIYETVLNKFALLSKETNVCTQHRVYLRSKCIYNFSSLLLPDLCWLQRYCITIFQTISGITSVCLIMTPFLSVVTSGKKCWKHDLIPLTFLSRVVSFKHQTFHSYISKWLSKFILISSYKIRVYTSKEVQFSSMKLRDKHSWNTRLNFIFEF